MSANKRTKRTPIIPTLQQDIWGDICRKLIEKYGIHIYNNWFSKLAPVIDEQNRTIELKAPNSFTQQWVKSNYEDTLRKIIVNLEMKFTEIKSESY